MYHKNSLIRVRRELVRVALVAAMLAPSLQAAQVSLSDPLEPGPAPVPDYADEWYLPTGNGTINLLVREYGQGEPFVVLHGGWGAEQEYMVGMLRSEFSRNRNSSIPADGTITLILPDVILLGPPYGSAECID